MSWSLQSFGVDADLLVLLAVDECVRVFWLHELPVSHLPVACMLHIYVAIVHNHPSQLAERCCPSFQRMLHTPQRPWHLP